MIPAVSRQEQTHQSSGGLERSASIFFPAGGNFATPRCHDPPWDLLLKAGAMNQRSKDGCTKLYYTYNNSGLLIFEVDGFGVLGFIVGFADFNSIVYSG